MSYTFKINESISRDGAGSKSGVATEVANSEFGVDGMYGIVTDQLLAGAFTAANVQSIFLLADADCTLEANSGSSPSFTLSLKAGRALVWAKNDGYYTNPITANITTGFYLTTTRPTRVRLSIGYN